MMELQRYGTCDAVARVIKGKTGATTASEFYLNEPQALLICIRSDAERAVDVHDLVAIKDGRALADSRVVAKAFGKRHDHVLRAIRDLASTLPQWGSPNFGETSYVEPQNGQTYQFYEMDRDAFALLAMGFTGAPAIEWKLKFIAAFNAMEQRLRGGDVSALAGALADSRKVAAKFGKRHDDVLKAIRNLNCSAEFRLRNFAEFKIKDLSKTSGESASHVEMTRDAFALLAMGFTGAPAIDDQLEKMAVRIRARAVRRCGELLKQFDAKGKRTDIEQPSIGGDTKFSQREAADNAGLSKRQQVQAVRLTTIPLAEFEREADVGGGWCDKVVLIRNDFRPACLLSNLAPLLRRVVLVRKLARGLRFVNRFSSSLTATARPALHP